MLKNSVKKNAKKPSQEKIVIPAVWDRITDLNHFLTNKNDNKLFQLLLSCIDKALNYTLKVNSMESQIFLNRYRLELEEYQELVIRLDMNRRTAHDALISECSIFNRELREKYKLEAKEFPGGIFGLSEARLINFDRHIVGDWAGEISNYLFTNRKVHRENINLHIPEVFLPGPR